MTGVVIVGTGFGCITHLRALRAAGFEVHALVGRDPEKTTERAHRFDVPNGTYTVRIHFCETWEGAKQPNLREFGIKIQGTKVVDKMDISGAAGGWMIPLVKEFKDIKVTDGKLVVEPFSNNGRDQHPSVEAYEVYAQ